MTRSRSWVCGHPQAFLPLPHSWLAELPYPNPGETAMKTARILIAATALATSAACAPGLGIHPRIFASPSGLSSAGPCYMYGDGLTALGLSAGPRFWGM